MARSWAKVDLFLGYRVQISVRRPHERLLFPRASNRALIIIRPVVQILLPSASLSLCIASLGSAYLASWITSGSTPPFSEPISTPSSSSFFSPPLSLNHFNSSLLPAQPAWLPLPHARSCTSSFCPYGKEFLLLTSSISMARFQYYYAIFFSTA